MPPLVEVKAAAERISTDTRVVYWCGDDPQFDAMKDGPLLARFALAVLNAPGMGHDRLCELSVIAERFTIGAAQEGVAVGTYGEHSAAIVELLAEVLRLRAACAVAAHD